MLNVKHMQIRFDLEIFAFHFSETFLVTLQFHAFMWP